MSFPQAISLKARALRFLSMREHSQAELRKKLAPHVQDGDDLDGLFEWLAAKDFLNEERAAESIVNRQAARYGAARVQQTLRQKGVPDALVKASVAQLKTSELPRALEVWRRKFGSLPDTPQARAKQMRFMASRGFDGQVLNKIWQAARDGHENFIDPEV